jgi:hypothetical protein
MSADGNQPEKKMDERQCTPCSDGIWRYIYIEDPPVSRSSWPRWTSLERAKGENLVNRQFPPQLTHPRGFDCGENTPFCHIPF